MSTPATGGTYSTVPTTSITKIDALISGTRWGGAVGTAATVTYSFPTTSSLWSTSVSNGYGPTTGDGEPWNGFSALNSAQKAAFRTILQSWSAVANLTFTEVSDTASEVGDIRIAFSSATTGYGGWAYYPTSAPIGGDIWLNPYATNQTLTAGNYGYTTMVHEVGHAIGLKHPFEDGTILPSGEDNNLYTVMSYTDPPASDIYPAGPMLYDILTLQYMYGINTSYRTGDDTYTFSNSSEELMAVWDAGGNDTFDASNQTLPVSIILRAGTFSSIGVRNSGGRASSNITIAYNVTIENAIGGSGNDTLRGNSAANLLSGGAGDDTLYGEGGNDTLYGGSGSDIAWIGDGGGVFTVAGIEILVGGSGADAIVLGDNATTMAMAGVESVTGGAGTDVLYFGNRGNTLTLTGIEVISGGVNTDVITLSSAEATVIVAGLETLNGGSGGDFVYLGNRGNTTTVTGVETLAGGVNTDIITLAGSGNTVVMAWIDAVTGSAGSDFLYLGNRGNTLTLTGIEILSGGINTDVIILGGNGNTIALAGIETLTGGAGADAVMLGNRGNTITVANVETLTGGGGADRIAVQAGSVLFEGRGGADSIALAASGGSRIVFSSIDDGSAAGIAAGFDTISGFLTGTDDVMIQGSLLSSIDRDGNGTVSVTSRSSGTINPANDEMVFLTETVSSLTDGGYSSVCTAAGPLVAGAGQAALLLANDGGSSGLFAVSDNGDGVLAASEIRLLGLFAGTVLGPGNISTA